MKIGFAKHDITPRVGVELCGFGPFRCRHSIGVRDNLWARAMAMEHGSDRALLISCDLIGTSRELGLRARDLIALRTGLPREAVMLCCTHTHSGPTTGPYNGWGEPDPPYIETLPSRIAQAAVKAMANLAEATLSHAEVPCEGVGLNREYDRDAPPLSEVLRDDWRPAKPELTDTTCHVMAARAGDELIGFVSYFGCHPVTCCADTRYIHGDYCGVATNLLEREHPGCVGLFLQGAQGDVNSCVVHKPEQESLLALDVIAARYANAVRAGIEQAQTIAVDTLRCHSRDVAFSRKPWGLDKLRALLAEKEARVHGPDVTDSFVAEDWNVRMETVYLVALRRLVQQAEAGDSLTPLTEVHGLRIGPISILGSGFETMQAIKNEVVAKACGPTTLVTGLTNDSVGYAPDRTAAARGGYAADMVPLICGMLPYANVHDELVEALLAVDGALA